MNLRWSELESRRFGMRVCRASVDSIDPDEFEAAVADSNADVVILRLPAGQLASLQSLRERGFDPIVADTLVRYEIGLPTALRPERSGAVRLRDATSEDAPRIEAMVREIFAGYASHYRANPLFSPSAILEGYAEWASSHVARKNGAFAWLIEYEGEVAGFSCCAIEPAGNRAVGTLNGVLPEWRGRGVYRGTLAAMLSELTARGIDRFVIATQVQNLIVQRAWNRIGFGLHAAENTVHINVRRVADVAC